MNAKSDRAVKIGLFLVALSWFAVTLLILAIGLPHTATVWPLVLVDVTSEVGIGFRAAAGFIAVISTLFYLANRDLSRPEAMMSLRWVVILEACYFLFLFPSGVWGITDATSGYPSGVLIVSTGLPCLLQSTVIPVALVKLFLELNPKKSARGATKWALISGTVYLFTYWFNYASQWIATIMQKGIEFVSLYPINLFGFALTAVGLLLLALYAAHFSKNTFGKEILTKHDLKKIGIVVTAFGLYFDLTLLLWILFGSVGGPNLWHTFFMYVNMDLWFLLLPLVGLPFLFKNRY